MDGRESVDGVEGDEEPRYGSQEGCMQLLRSSKHASRSKAARKLILFRFRWDWEEEVNGSYDERKR